MLNQVTSDPAAQLRVTQMIGAALLMGVVIFAAIAAVISPMGQALEAVAYGLDPIALVAVLLTISVIPLSFFIPARMIDSARGASPAQRGRVFRTSKILAAALCEAPALLWCVGLLLSGNRWFLVPIAMIATLMALQIATRGAFESATGQRTGGN